MFRSTFGRLALAALLAIVPLDALAAPGSNVQVKSQAGASLRVGLTENGLVYGSEAAGVASTAAMTNGQLLVGQTSAAPLPKTVSGDATLAASGALTVTGSAGAFTSTGLLTSSAGATVSGGTVALNASSGTNAVNIGTGTSTGTVTLGGTGTQAIAVGDGAGVKTVTLGSATTTSSTTIRSGTGDLSIVSTDDLTINGGSAGSVLNFGTNVDGNVIHIGDDDTAADTLTIGSAKDTTTLAGIAVSVGSTGTTSATALKAGSGGITVTSAVNKGTCTLGGESPAVCPAQTTIAGLTCVCSPVGTSAAIAAAGCAASLSSTTLTLTSANGLTNAVNWMCF